MQFQNFCILLLFAISFKLQFSQIQCLNTSFARQQKSLIDEYSITLTIDQTDPRSFIFQIFRFDLGQIQLHGVQIWFQKVHFFIVIIIGEIHLEIIVMILILFRILILKVIFKN
eukprot:09819.XXX_110107_110445_1 [CDS] Oithona nana genome sequencing.